MSAVRRNQPLAWACYAYTSTEHTHITGSASLSTSRLQLPKLDHCKINQIKNNFPLVGIKMASRDSKPLEAETPLVSSSPSFSENWKERIFIPTLLAGIAGGGFGLVSKHRKVHVLANISATYATNFAIVSGCYCGAREFVRVTRKSEPDDLVNSAIAGIGSGALLGRLQGGRFGAYRYSIIFAVLGTTVDFATIKLRPRLRSFKESLFGNKEEKPGWLKLPEWFPIQVVDEEALAAKKAREKQLYAQRALGKLSKEGS